MESKQSEYSAGRRNPRIGQIYRQRLRTIDALVNSGASALQLAIELGGNTYGVQSATDWSSFVALYSEFRIRSVAMTFSGHATSALTVPLPNPTLYVAFDEAAITTTPLSGDNVTQYDNVRIVPQILGSNIGTKSIGFRFPGSQKDSQYVTNWIPTNNPSVHPGTIFFSSNVQYTTAGSWGIEWSLEFDVEFRLRH
jgi:hypothetical protein